MAFLDAHVEVNRGWLEPLLSAVATDRTMMAVPHVDRINPWQITYDPWMPQQHGSFDWNMDYR